MLIFSSAIIQAFSIASDCHSSFNNKNQWIFPPENFENTSPPDLIQLFNDKSEIFGQGSHGVVKVVNTKTSPSLKFSIKRIQRELEDQDEVEFQMLEHLSGYDISPDFYACQKDYSYLYLAQQMLPNKLDEFKPPLRNENVKIIIGMDKKALFRLFRTFFVKLIWLHELGYMHNDLKPANIMANSDFSEIFLIDFGLSDGLLQSDSPSDEKEIKFIKIAGTPLYVNFEKRRRRFGIPMDDFYSAALSIAETFSSVSNIFYTRTFKSPDEVFEEQNCYRKKYSDYFYGFENFEKFRDFCVNFLKTNVINALRTKFGNYQESSSDSTINFTTFLAKIVDFERFEETSSPVNVDWLKKNLNNVARNMGIETLSEENFTPAKRNISPAKMEETNFGLRIDQPAEIKIGLQQAHEKKEYSVFQNPSDQAKFTGIEDESPLGEMKITPPQILEAKIFNGRQSALDNSSIQNHKLGFRNNFEFPPISEQFDYGRINPSKNPEFVVGDTKRQDYKIGDYPVENETIFSKPYKKPSFEQINLEEQNLGSNQGTNPFKNDYHRINDKFGGNLSGQQNFLQEDLIRNYRNHEPLLEHEPVVPKIHHRGFSDVHDIGPRNFVQTKEPSVYRPGRIFEEGSKYLLNLSIPHQDYRSGQGLGQQIDFQARDNRGPSESNLGRSNQGQFGNQAVRGIYSGAGSYYPGNYSHNHTGGFGKFLLI